MGRDVQRSRVQQFLHRGAARVEEIQMELCDKYVRCCGNGDSRCGHVCARKLAHYGFCGDLSDGDCVGESFDVASGFESGVDDIYVLDVLSVGLGA